VLFLNSILRPAGAPLTGLPIHLLLIKLIKAIRSNSTTSFHRAFEKQARTKELSSLFWSSGWFAIESTLSSWSTPLIRAGIECWWHFRDVIGSNWIADPFMRWRRDLLTGVELSTPTRPMSHIVQSRLS
jgi:hypothetical protein